MMSSSSPHLPRIAEGLSHRASGGFTPRATSCPPLPTEGEHRLEKLQFALAIALTRGEDRRSQELREEIAQIGEHCEEPGT